LKDSLGGGLCQLSGLIYYISLHANLEILERHSHSVDIYTDETRFTPLGSDATVAYGYKDLKIRNNLKDPIRFSFLIEEKYLIINLMHSSLIKKNKVEFRENEIDKETVEVDTLINNELVNKSKYKRLVPNNAYSA
jgi:vancomycin resistance protein VanW